MDSATTLFFNVFLGGIFCTLGILALYFYFVKTTNTKPFYSFSQMFTVNILMAFAIAINKAFIHFDEIWKVSILISASTGIGLVVAEVLSRIKKKYLYYGVVPKRQNNSQGLHRK